jgi:hypothetical protein
MFTATTFCQMARAAFIPPVEHDSNPACRTVALPRTHYGRPLLSRTAPPSTIERPPATRRGCSSPTPQCGCHACAPVERSPSLGRVRHGLADAPRAVQLEDSRRRLRRQRWTWSLVQAAWCRSPCQIKRPSLSATANRSKRSVRRGSCGRRAWMNGRGSGSIANVSQWKGRVDRWRPAGSPNN